MSFWKPNYDEYPGLTTAQTTTAATVVVGGTTDSGLPGASDNRGNWLDDILTNYDPYPIPASTTADPSAPATAQALPAQPTQALVRTSAAVPQPVAQQPAAAQPTAAMPVSIALQRAFCFSPAFHGERGEKKTPEEQHVTHEALPVSFTVPSGCNAVDLWFGPIEPAPGARPADFQHVIQTGKGRIVDGDGRSELDEEQLQPGQHINVVVPWRAASTAKIAPGRLRMAVMAQFYASTDKPQN